MSDEPTRLRRTIDRVTARTVVKSLLIVALVAIVGVFVVYAVPQLVGAEESYVVLSGSMQPTMGPGDVILVDAVDISAVEAGDIVTFETGSAAVTTHRVVEKVSGESGPSLRTKGDNNEDADVSPVSENALIGRVMTVGSTPVVIPAVGHVIQFARTQIGQWLLFYLPLTLLILNEFYRRLGRTGPESDGTDPAAEPRASTDGGVAFNPGSHAVAEGTNPVATPVGGSAERAADREGTAETDGLTLAAASLRTPVAVLGLLTTYTGWLTVTEPSVLTSTVLAGSAVALLLALYARLTAEGDPVGPLTTEEITLTMPVLVVLVGTSGWLAVTRESVPSAMLAAGSGVAIVLLAAIWLLLWWHAESPGGTAQEAPVDARTGNRGESEP